MRILLSCLLILALVPGWAGRDRLPLYEGAPQMDAHRVALDPHDPSRRRLGALTYLGGVELTGRSPAFGGFSSLTVSGEHFMLLSDGGNVARFTMGADWKPHGLRFDNLPSGPANGWLKSDRDSESLAVDPTTGTLWVGFENFNQIWRYAPDFARAEGYVAPPAMADWPGNGGPESLARMPDGRFVTISEEARIDRPRWRGSAEARRWSRQGLIFAGDPLRHRPRRFAYMVSPNHDVADVAALPDGALIVVERQFRLPFRFSNRIMYVPAAEVAPGRVARGRLLAELDAPLIHDNFEGVAVTHEAGATILWLVSDDNQFPLERTYLLKFRLDRRPAER
ncbi:esterase-like activity of phytase family protein [Sphingomonas sanguinis]|uniref:esterase-like activity of phytase family protein n=1 Tax=Sphingomonas sp. LC-1 TaxID=3110957 RepID=UPI0021BA7514|nr:esterase-like activity of phytase family protein [Sphingomonas sp. LC-1]MCT8001171.1 esterase-like activity of phytase family protein [Sphingomonas sp. LC-1]